MAAKRIAIVTGATSGVGREFVRQLDAEFCGAIDEMWLVARSEEGLVAVDEETSHACRLFPLDLTRKSSWDAIEAELAAEKDVQVMWLVNSAGYGRFGRMWDISAADNVGMVRLNCVALTAMCSAALPYMDRGSCIVNLASVAGLMPQPELSVYCATKRFVLDVTRTLNYELKGTGITACAVCPKFMDTRFLNNAGDAQAVRRMTSIGFEDVEHVVRSAIRASQAGRATCIPAPDMRIAYAAAKVLPSNLVFKAQDTWFTLVAGPSTASRPQRRPQQ